MSALIIVSARSQLFTTVSGDHLDAIFNGGARGQDGTEIIFFATFLSNVDLKPNGRGRDQGWSVYDYEKYFKDRNIFTEDMTSFPHLGETRVSLASLNGEPILLLSSTRKFPGGAEDSWTRGGETPHEFQFLARYLGDSAVQVLCGRPRQYR